MKQQMIYFFFDYFYIKRTYCSALVITVYKKHALPLWQGVVFFKTWTSKLHRSFLFDLTATPVRQSRL